MKVILLEKIHKLGDLGDTVRVKSGYGRNYLIPQGKAVSATKENLAKFEARRAELEKAAAEALSAAQKRAEAIKDLNIVIACKTHEEGKIFGSVSAKDVVDAIADKGVVVEKREVILPEGSVHQIGEYEITLRLHSDVVVPLKISVTDESGRIEIKEEPAPAAAEEKKAATVAVEEKESTTTAAASEHLEKEVKAEKGKK